MNSREVPVVHVTVFALQKGHYGGSSQSRLCTDGCRMISLLWLIYIPQDGGRLACIPQDGGRLLCIPQDGGRLLCISP